VGDRVLDLSLQVEGSPGDRLGQSGAGGDRADDLPGEATITVQKMLGLLD
jgi:hypothetical protein